MSLGAEEQSTHDSVLQLLELAREAQDENLDKTVELCTQALEILKDHPDEALLHQTYLLLANTNRLKGLYEESLKNLEHIIQDDFEPEERESNALAYLTAASNLERMGEYVQAYDFSIKALNNFERLQDYRHVVETKIFIGNLFNVLRNFNNAVQYLDEARFLAKEIEFADGLYGAEIRLGRSYQKMGEWDSSRACMRSVIDGEDSSSYQKAYAYYIIGQTYLDEQKWALALESELISLEYALKDQNIYIQSVVYTDLAFIEMNLGHYENALVYNENALALRIERGNQSLIASSLRNIGTLNLRFGKYDEAISYLMKALKITETNNEPHTSSDIYFNLSKTYYALGQFQESYDNLLEYAMLKDKIYDQSLISNIQDIELEYFINKKNTELELLKRDSEIKELEIKRETLLRNSIIIISIFLIVIIFLLLNRYKANEKMSEKLEEMVDMRTTELNNEIKIRKKTEVELNRSLKEKELLLREIHHRVKNNLQVISGLLLLQQDEIKTKEDAIKGFQSSQDRIQAMAKAYELLLGSPYMSEVSVGTYIRELGTQIKYNYDLLNMVTLHYSMDEVVVGIEILDRLGLILNELLTNAIKYAFDGRDAGDIHIKLQSREDKFELIISDNGIGISKDYDDQNPHTLGLSIVQMLIQQLYGTMTVDRINGTSFTLVIPFK
jgi:two-component sensor histidine kinase/tetratricopeptide (TPR) repeat protein